MSTLQCRIGGPTCKGSIRTNAEVSPGATYTCSECNEKPAQNVFYDPYGHANPTGRRKRQAKKISAYFRDVNEENTEAK